MDIQDRGGAGISKVVRPLHIKDDSCMCKGGGGGGLQQVMCIEQRQWFFRKQEGT